MKNKQELFKEIYTLAAKLKAVAPWDFMYESEIFGVTVPGTDRTCFISVMGADGEFFAISAYRGKKGLSQFYNFLDNAETMPPETILTIPHFMLSFIDREDLSPEQLESIKSSGVPFRGKGNWPSLEQTDPGYIPMLPEDGFLPDLVVILEQVLGVVRRTERGTGFLYEEHEEYDAMLTREKNPSSGKWEDVYHPLPKLEEATIYRSRSSEIQQKQVKGLPESRHMIQMDVALLPSPIKEGSKRGYFPFGLLLLDKQSGAVVSFEMLTPVPDIDTMYEKVPQALLEQLLKYGFRPARIEVRSDLVYRLVAPSLKKVGCRLLTVSHMPAMDEFIQGMAANLG